ncbi:MAG: hypothetical protein ACRDHZ_02095, partial [Ktedonobacteraceae bacterium]
VLLNGQRVRSSMLVKHGELLEIGAHRFLMKIAQKPVSADDANDPLLKYVRKPTAHTHGSGEYTPVPQLANKPPAGPTRALQHQPNAQEPIFTNSALDIAQQETSLIQQVPHADNTPTPCTTVEPAPLNLPRTLRLPSKLIQ